VTFDFASYRGVRLFHIERSTSVNYKFNKWFVLQRCRSRSMGISVT